ncbi:Retrotransposon gag protein [Corchorus capsularis]|uniref:Retrotransposon gag protein n=1 Tax=Corchorus capsularis TaxID=210143 RepID=A0A1R3KHX1_COCAP|nr:Retrotransposon gag protein [Corchorus capsularis]
MKRKSMECSDQEEFLSCRQLPGEHWYQYWKRYSAICEFYIDCNLPETELVPSFYDGLSYSNRATIDAASGEQETLTEQEAKLRMVHDQEQLDDCEQLPEEHLHQYWERFNKICDSHPHHGYSEEILIGYFYSNLEPFEKYKIEIASGGIHMHSESFFTKTLDEQKTIIEEAVAKSAKEASIKATSSWEEPVQSEPTLPKEISKIVPEEPEESKEDIKMDITPPSPPSFAKPEDEPQDDEQLGYPKLKELSVLNFVDNPLLVHKDRDFLGINKLLESYYFEEINMDQFFLEDKKICRHEDTFQRRDENNANQECQKHPLHQPLTATKMALSFLAIHGVALNKIGFHTRDTR